MKVLITGGTGLVGSALIKAILSKGYHVTVLTRNPAKVREKFGENVSYCTSLNSLSSLDGYDAVVNLAGEPIADKRWTKEQKERLKESRFHITNQLSELILKSDNPPQVLVSGSAVGYYGAQGDTELIEGDAPHDEFTYHLCEEWEHLALKADNPKTRVCIMRTGIVLSANGGMLSKLALPFRLGLGAYLGNGKQYISWIHIQDMVNAIIFLLESNHTCGVYNFTAPEPVTNKVFSKAFAKSLHRPCLFMVPAFVIKTAMGEVSTLLLDGQRVLPRRLLDEGYIFSFTNIKTALEDIANKMG